MADPIREFTIITTLGEFRRIVKDMPDSTPMFADRQETGVAESTMITIITDSFGPSVEVS